MEIFNNITERLSPYIDKAQLLYCEDQDVSFWHGFVKSHLSEPQLPLCLVLFASYGNVHLKIDVFPGMPITQYFLHLYKALLCSEIA
jgi:hypothetical protein